MPWLHESGPFQGSYGQPRETTQHLLGHTWTTFRPTKFKTHYVQIAPNFLHWNAHIFLFGLILRAIPNSITPQSTLRQLPIPVGLLVLPCAGCLPLLPPPLFVSCPRQRNCRDRRVLQLLALNVHVKLWPDLTRERDKLQGKNFIMEIKVCLTLKKYKKSKTYIYIVIYFF